MQPISDAATTAPTTPLSQVLPLLDTDEFHPLPLLVAEDGRLLGLIEPRDVGPLLDVQDVLGMQSPALPLAENGMTPTSHVMQGKQQGTLSWVDSNDTALPTLIVRSQRRQCRML